MNLVGCWVLDSLQDGFQSHNIVLQIQAQDRGQSLTSWQRQTHPLSYDNNAYYQLVDAGCANRGNHWYGLSQSAAGHKSVNWFVHELVKSAMKSGVHIIPTFWKAGQSLLVFCIVTDPRQVAQLCASCSVVCGVVKTLSIDDVGCPRWIQMVWTMVVLGQPARPVGLDVQWILYILVMLQAMKMLRNFWIFDSSIEACNSDLASPMNLTSQLKMRSPMMLALIGPVVDYCWRMNIHDILACTLLPYEWNIASMTWPQSFNSNYVEATYTWVCNNYDGTKPLHKLTLVYAMIFSKIPSHWMCLQHKTLYHLSINVPGSLTRILIAKATRIQSHLLLWWPLSSFPFMKIKAHYEFTWRRTRIPWESHGQKNSVHTSHIPISTMPNWNYPFRYEGDYLFQSSANGMGLAIHVAQEYSPLPNSMSHSFPSHQRWSLQSICKWLKLLRIICMNNHLDWLVELPH